jgi:hypothetical protein
MNILRPGIETKLAGSAIESDVGGRWYYLEADSDDYPRLVFSGVSNVPDNVFAKKGESVLVQFDLFSMKSAGKAEIETMKVDTIALFDDCTLTLTGHTLCQFTRTNILGPMTEDLSALQDGSSIIYHTIVEYNVDYQVT